MEKDQAINLNNDVNITVEIGKKEKNEKLLPILFLSCVLLLVVLDFIDIHLSQSSIAVNNIWRAPRNLIGSTALFLSLISFVRLLAIKEVTGMSRFIVFFILFISTLVIAVCFFLSHINYYFIFPCFSALVIIPALSISSVFCFKSVKNINFILLLLLKLVCIACPILSVILVYQPFASPLFMLAFLLLSLISKDKQKSIKTEKTGFMSFIKKHAPLLLFYLHIVLFPLLYSEYGRYARHDASEITLFIALIFIPMAFYLSCALLKKGGLTWALIVICSTLFSHFAIFLIYLFKQTTFKGSIQHSVLFIILLFIVCAISFFTYLWGYKDKKKTSTLIKTILSIGYSIILVLVCFASCSFQSLIRDYLAFLVFNSISFFAITPLKKNTFDNAN